MMKTSLRVVSGLIRTTGLCLLLLAATGCAPVAPWERGNLAKPNMALDGAPLEAAFMRHAYGSKESASGGYGVGGGGCGCN